ncbi:hypothetical protein LCGC14_2108180 [marine sediment metagenome]|uniref:Glycosyltransferase 2-like domain-containing protein n=1 Tax=marine sediment metagenome TaxID=412755 RepID=A0A0F9H458_9ZZZZ
MARLCLSVHAKNEGLILPGWFEAHQGLAEEFLLVDTGSTDNTIEIGERWKAHIRRQDIEQGFDVVRTYCITEARELGCEWVIILDADERLYRILPEFTLVEEPTEIDMTTLWPAGGSAPTHCKYEAVQTGAYYNQHDIIRGLLEDPFCVAYNTRRRHWFDLEMRRPCQPWCPVPGTETEGIDDWQRRFCRTDKDLKFIRKVHEWLRRPDGGEPEPILDAEQVYFDHFHVPAKAIYPDRADEVNALVARLREADTEFNETY